MCVIWFICLHSGLLGLQSTDTECLPAKLSCKEICTKWCRTLRFSTSLSQSSFHLTVDGKVQSPNLSLFVLWLICIPVVKNFQEYQIIAVVIFVHAFYCIITISQAVHWRRSPYDWSMINWSLCTAFLLLTLILFFLIKNANKWNIRYIYIQRTVFNSFCSFIDVKCQKNFQFPKNATNLQYLWPSK